MSEPKIDYQCYICPWCYNDHDGDKCKTVDVKERVEKLKAENELMREALEFYAAELNIPMADISNYYNVSNDLGKVTHEYTSRARDCLAKLSKKEG